MQNATDAAVPADAEAIHRIENDRLKEALEYLKDGFVIYDDQERMVYCNRSFRQMHGPIADLIEPGITFEGMVRLGCEHGVWAPSELDTDTFVKKAGHRRRSDPSTMSLIHFADGRWTGRVDYEMRDGYTVGLRVDVTETRRREAELKKAREAAEAAERAKTEFLANMSHEIRTPMNGVMGMAELLTQTALDEKQQMFADVIVKSSGSLLTIINDILDFSKLDAGQMQLDMAPFRVHEAVEDVAALMASEAAEKGLELIVRVDPKLPDMVVGDVGRIRQIVTNLVGNAIKFTEEGHVYVNVDGRAVGVGDSAAALLKVTVEDTGVGIPADKVDQIFEKFSQVDGSATRKHEGTGLGLSISKNLVELMGGEIAVESTFGEGTRFSFSLTLPVHGAAKQASAAPIDISGALVLVIDDNWVNRSILTEQLTAWKLDCGAVRSGAEGLAALRAAKSAGETVDLVILDYQMPDMSGSDVVKAMKADADLAYIPIILLTSVDQTNDGEGFSALDIQDHMTKPARSAELQRSIVAVLSNASAAALAPAPTSARDQPRAHAQDKRIDVLVCEDNHVNQIVFSESLRRLGYSFEVANNGREGVTLFERLRPSAVIMDVSMPEMNGLDATRAIREIEGDQGPRTPVIGVTAHAMSGDLERCLDASMDDYLAKPISPAALGEKLAYWLEAAGGGVKKSA